MTYIYIINHGTKYGIVAQLLPRFVVVGNTDTSNLYTFIPLIAISTFPFTTSGLPGRAPVQL